MRKQTKVRKTTAPKFTRGADNVFEDLGFEAKEAANLKILVDLLLNDHLLKEACKLSDEQFGVLIKNDPFQKKDCKVRKLLNSLYLSHSSK